MSQLAAVGCVGTKCSAAFMTWSKPSQDHQGPCKCQPSQSDRVIPDLPWARAQGSICRLGTAGRCLGWFVLGWEVRLPQEQSGLTRAGSSLALGLAQVCLGHLLWHGLILKEPGRGESETQFGSPSLTIPVWLSLLLKYWLIFKYLNSGALPCAPAAIQKV